MEINNPMEDHETKVRRQIAMGIRKKRPEVFKRTENNIQYVIPANIYTRFVNWSTNERKYGRPDSFTFYYENKLSEGLRNLITRNSL